MPSFLQFRILDLLDVLVPPYCVVCNRPLLHGFICRSCELVKPNLNYTARCNVCYSENLTLQENSGLCQVCKTYPLPFGAIRFLWEYGGTTQRVIRAMKYRPSKKLARLLGELIAETLTPFLSLGSWDYIVAMPASPINEKRRGFNQALLLAEAIKSKSPSLKRTPISDLLKHHGKKLPQARTPQSQRLQNARGRFVIKKHFPEYSRILLVEDVLATGASAVEAATVLLKSGAFNVDIVAVARSQGWQRFRALLYKRYKDAI